MPSVRGGFLIPAAQAVAAEPGQVHHVDVLHIGAVLHQMLNSRRKAAASIRVRVASSISLSYSRCVLPEVSPLQRPVKAA
jgi:hypothetical protein